MRYNLSIAIFTFLVANFAPGLLYPAIGAEVFTPEQRAAIIQIVRDALKQDPSILRDSVSALQDDDARGRDETARAAIQAHHDALYDPADPVAGNPNGAITIVEFFDPRCPYCRQVEPMMDAWLQHDPDIRVIYKDLPILGPPSQLGSRALLAAQVQGGYARLRQAMMRDSPDISEDSIRGQAERVGLDWKRLRRDMDDPAIQTRLQGNVGLARLLGIEGTPAFIVGEKLVMGSELTDVQGAVASIRSQQATTGNAAPASHP